MHRCTGSLSCQFTISNSWAHLYNAGSCFCYHRQLASESPQLRALGAAVAAATAADDDGSGKEELNAAQGRGSNGNSGVGDAEGDAVAAAKRETHDASMRGTAQVSLIHVLIMLLWLSFPPRCFSSGPGNLNFWEV